MDKTPSPADLAILPRPLRPDRPAVSTCTVVVGSGGERCGRDAVHTWTSARGGETLGECVDHDSGYRVPSSPWAPGTPVTVMHQTWRTPGVVLVEKPTTVTVELTLRNGDRRLRTILKVDVLRRG